MKYDLSQKVKDFNTELFINGHLTKEQYFSIDVRLDEMKDLFIVYLN